MSNNIHLVLASDNNYAQHLGVTMVSILENNHLKSNIVFHILENNLNQENKEKLKIIKDKYNCQLFFYNIQEQEIENFPDMGYVGKTAYLRLFIPRILPKEINRVLYLDCDLIVLNDLQNLYQLELQGKSLAAIKDVKSEDILRIFFYPGIKKYFNSGVILIDVNAWREKNITKKAIDFIKKYQKQITSSDQDVLNCLFINDWLEIDKIYNLDLKHERINKLPSKDTVIFHYSDRIKPWSYLYTGKNKKYYFKYLSLTPWNDFKYSDKNLKNFFKKYKLVLLKIIKNLLRPLIPNKLIDWHKERFLSRNIRKAL